MIQNNQTREAASRLSALYRDRSWFGSVGAGTEEGKTVLVLHLRSPIPERERIDLPNHVLKIPVRVGELTVRRSL